MTAPSHRTPKVPIADIPGSLPQVTIPEDIDHESVSAACLKTLVSLNAGCLTPDALWRDLFALTGTLRTFYGTERIIAAWTELADLHRSRNFCLLQGSSHVARYGPKTSWIEAMFSFETDGKLVSRGSGTLMLVPDQDGAWKIWVLCTLLEEINGFGNVDVLEPQPSAAHQTNGFPNGHTTDPTHRDCVIVGGGASGLSLAGRLKALGVSCMAVDRNAEIGGNWTTRYQSLKLHTSKESCQMPFGRTWGPEFDYFLSGQDLARGYQKFVDQYNIDVRLSTNVEAAAWSGEDRKWTIKMTTHGMTDTVTARHLVFAIGSGGQAPLIPSFTNRESFKGEVIHSVDYRTSLHWKGKSGVIIGTANTAHDIAEDMLDAGLASVTMVQRNVTPVLPIAYYKAIHDPIFNDQIPTDLADRMYYSTPRSIARQLILGFVKAHANADSEHFDALERAGFRNERYCDMIHIVFERMGGHYMDVGASAKIVAGLIKVKSSPTPPAYTSTGLAFADGSTIDADVIVFATGFEINMRTRVAQIVGAEVADQLEDCSQLDSEGEVLGGWKPIGHPGIWYQSGDIGHARFFSRFVAIQIKADLVGTPLVPYTKFRP